MRHRWHVFFGQRAVCRSHRQTGDHDDDAPLRYRNVDNVLGPTRLFFSTYLESIWLLQICVATDLVAPLDRALADRVRDRIIEPSRAIIAEYDEGASNRQVWNDVALLAAARLVGLPVGRRVFFAFVASGALAGLAGALYAARFGTLDANAGLGSELNVVAAVVVGGVAIFGGSGTVWGAALGAFLLVTINRALPILGISDFWQGAVVGALIIGSIVLDRVLTLRRTHQLIEARDES